MEDNQILEKPTKKAKKDKVILPIYVNVDVYAAISELVASECRKKGKTIRKSSFVEDKILIPFINKGRKNGSI